MSSITLSEPAEVHLISTPKLDKVRIHCQPVLRANVLGLGEITVMLEVDGFMERFSQRYAYDVIIRYGIDNQNSNDPERISFKVYSSRCGWSDPISGKTLRPNGKAALMRAAHEALSDLERLNESYNS